MLRFVLATSFVLLAGCGGETTYLVRGPGCDSPDQCKGDRICVDHRCRYPGEAGQDGGARNDAGPRLDGGSDGGSDGGTPGDGTIGASCENERACDEGTPPFCLTEEGSFGLFTGGYCTTACDDSLECPAGSSCAFSLNQGSGMCVSGCRSDDDCRVDYICATETGVQGCVPPLLGP